MIFDRSLKKELTSYIDLLLGGFQYFLTAGVADWTQGGLEAAGGANERESGALVAASDGIVLIWNSLDSSVIKILVKALM